MPRKGIQIVAEESIAQTGQDIARQVARCTRRSRTRIVHCGFGFGIVVHQPGARRARTGIRPGTPGTAFQNAWINPIMWNAILGWTGVDQYDEANLGRPGSSSTSSRPPTGGVREYCVPS